MSDGDPGSTEHDPPAPQLEDPLPAGHPAVASVVVDGATVLYDDRSGRCHVLNPTAGIIWSCLGTGGTIGDLVADIAAAYAMPVGGLAGDVLGAIADLARNDALDDGQPVVASGIRYLEEARNACMLTVDGLGWQATVGVELPTGLRIGVRTDTEETAAAVRRALGSLVVEDPASRPNLSLRLERQEPGPVESLHSLYRSCSLALRTRHRSRAVAALGHHVWSFVAAERDDAVVLATTGLERDGRLVLAPPRLRARIGAVEPGLARAGITVVDAPVVALCPDGALGVDVLAPPVPAAAELASPPPGRYLVAGRLLVGGQEEPDRTALLAGALADIVNIRRIGSARSLAAAARVSAAPTVVAPSWGNVPLADAALALFELE